MKEKINIIKRKNGESQGVGALGFEPRSAGLFPVHSSSQSSRIR